MPSTTYEMSHISLRDVQMEWSADVCPEKKHKGSYGTAMDHSMEDISEVSEQPLKSSNVASTGLLSIKMPESLCISVRQVTSSLAIVTVTHKLSRVSIEGRLVKATLEKFVAVRSPPKCPPYCDPWQCHRIFCASSLGTHLRIIPSAQLLKRYGSSHK